MLKGCFHAPRRDLLRTERSQSLISRNLPGNHHPRHDLQVLQQGGASSCGNVSELRDNLARAASNHVPTSNHSWLLVLYFPQVLKCWIRFSFFFREPPLMHCCNPPKGMNAFHTRMELRLYLTANMMKSRSDTKCDLFIRFFIRFYIQIHVYITCPLHNVNSLHHSLLIVNTACKFLWYFYLNALYLQKLHLSKNPSHFSLNF